MLSFLRFLIRIAMFANKDEQWRGLIGIDSQSLLEALYDNNEENSGKQLAYLDVLDAEWDLLVEIHDDNEALHNVPKALVVDLIVLAGEIDNGRNLPCMRTVLSIPCCLRWFIVISDHI